MEDFYVSLLSTANAKTFKNNRTSSFTNCLSNRIELNSSYRVSVCEISIPSKKQMNNISTGNNKIFFQINVECIKKSTELETFQDEFEIKIPDGRYETMDELIKNINLKFAEITPCENFLFEISPTSNKILLNPDIYKLPKGGT